MPSRLCGPYRRRRLVRGREIGKTVSVFAEKSRDCGGGGTGSGDSGRRYCPHLFILFFSSSFSSFSFFVWLPSGWHPHTPRVGPCDHVFSMCGFTSYRFYISPLTHTLSHSDTLSHTLSQTLSSTLSSHPISYPLSPPLSHALSPTPFHPLFLLHPLNPPIHSTPPLSH